MKKMIFGCSLMLGGIIGGIGWLIAKAILGQGTYATVFRLVGFSDGFIALLFFAIAIYGAVIAIKSMNE